MLNTDVEKLKCSFEMTQISKERILGLNLGWPPWLDYNVFKLLYFYSYAVVFYCTTNVCFEFSYWFGCWLKATKKGNQDMCSFALLHFMDFLDLL